MTPLRERKNRHRTNRLLLSLLFPVFLDTVLGAQPAVTEWRQIQISSAAEFTATRIAVSRFGDVYLLDADRSLLARLSHDGRHIRTVGGWGESGELFTAGTDLTASHGLDILLLDSDTHRLIRFDRQLNFLNEIDLHNSEYGSEFPDAVARNRAGGVVVASDSDDRVTLINLGGDVLSVMGDDKYGEDRFGHVTAVAVNDRNEIGVIDEGRLLVVMNRSGRLLWRRQLETQSSFIEGVGESWLIGSSSGGFTLVDRDSQTAVAEVQPLPITVADMAVDGERVFILGEGGVIFTASLTFDE